MRMRILKKHGTGIPDAVLACLQFLEVQFQVVQSFLGLMSIYQEYILYMVLNTV